MVQICSDFEKMMAFWRRWFIKREFWNRSMWNIICSMCWFEFQDRTGWCFSPTGRGKGTNSHPHWPWDVTQYQNGGTNETEGTHGKVRQVRFSDVRWTYTWKTKGYWRYFLEKETYLKTIKFWEVAVAIDLSFWWLWPMADLCWSTNHLYCSFTLSSISCKKFNGWARKLKNRGIVMSCTVSRHPSRHCVNSCEQITVAVMFRCVIGRRKLVEPAMRLPIQWEISAAPLCFHVRNVGLTPI